MPFAHQMPPGWVSLCAVAAPDEDNALWFPGPELVAALNKGLASAPADAIVHGCVTHADGTSYIELGYVKGDLTSGNRPPGVFPPYRPPPGAR